MHARGGPETLLLRPVQVWQSAKLRHNLTEDGLASVNLHTYHLPRNRKKILWGPVLPLSDGGVVLASQKKPRPDG